MPRTSASSRDARPHPWLRSCAELGVAGALMVFMDFEGFQTAAVPVPTRAVKLLAGALVLALLLARRRYPVSALLGASVLLGVLPAAGLPLALIAFATARRVPDPRRRIAVLLAAYALAVLASALCARPLGAGSWQYGLALGAMLAGVTVIVPGLVGAAAGQQDRLVAALAERTAAAEEAQRLADSESRIHERSRIAAEMHDLVGHRLSLISLHAGGLELALAKQAPQLREEAVLVRTATRDAMRELREVLGVLGPLGRDTGTTALTDATGTRPDIEALVAESRSGGIPVTLTWTGPDLDEVEGQSVRRAVHRVVRESLTNVHRYAPGAPVAVTVEHTGEQVRTVVRNGPPPASAPATGLGTGRGLTGLRERVGLTGGGFTAGPTADGGFEVTATIPTGPHDAPPAPAPVRRPEAATSAEEFAQSEGWSGILQRRLGGAVTALVALGGLSVMMAFAVGLVSQARPGPEVPAMHEVKVGMSRKEVMRSLSLDSPAVRAAAEGHEPPRPRGVTDCVFPYTNEMSDTGELEVTRYCFAGDTLAAVDTFDVPLAP
ncbi:two-component sensor histidine kinase [Streptomyces spiroverticillatus]|uniref:histidine kinase n=1 Tax=Streptomyces finlayi TaxID=67296 RepID=A0A918WYD7_9ACTN|nr:histidine kinase [Streptomyces finlayi]GHA11961.1 two-component sensor histidine kinase [Streptomyces spiroverticillatus]GHC94695.1 two-component sensor histidine kinase [Streptomyces finlayi]